MSSGGKRPGAGRPRLPAGERRSARLWLQLTPAEKRRIEAAARAERMEVRDYLLSLVPGV